MSIHVLLSNGYLDDKDIEDILKCTDISEKIDEKIYTPIQTW
jgi:hypothetical protein